MKWEDANPEERRAISRCRQQWGLAAQAEDRGETIPDPPCHPTNAGWKPCPRCADGGEIAIALAALPLNESKDHDN